MSKEERMQELKETVQELLDSEEDFIVEIPLGKENADAEEKSV